MNTRRKKPLLPLLAIILLFGASFLSALAFGTPLPHALNTYCLYLGLLTALAGLLLFIAAIKM